MSILIKGMSMPEDCDNCRFYNDDYDYPTCCITAHSRGYTWTPFGKRMPDCPLIELPPHGRLIDADELKEVLDSSWSASTWWFTNKVDDAPTVIPPDKDGEE